MSCRSSTPTGSLGPGRQVRPEECSPNSDSAGLAGCVAVRRVRTSHAMTKKHTPRNRSRHSRTNGRPPKPRYVDLVIPGNQFSCLGTFFLEEVETIELRVPRGRRGLASWTHPAMLALADLQSDCDVFLVNDSSSRGYSPDLFDDSHTYSTPDGWAHTCLDYRKSVLRVVSGYDGPVDAINAMLSWCSESDEKWVDRVEIDVSQSDLQYDPLEDTLNMAVYNRFDWFQVVGDPTLLLPFVRRELKVNDEQNFEVIISKSIATFQKVFRSRR